MFVARESEDTEELGSINPTFILTDLQPGTRYSFNVQAVGPRDRMSARASASVRQQTITEPPPQFQVTNTRFDSISLSWTVARGELRCAAILLPIEKFSKFLVNLSSLI